ncbi:amine oxidase [Rhodococcus sp. 05-2256-B2]|uniref:NAD(P)/FAD-dependent oxidoreductase n=1 Tax=Nocardiaceae TaxID=85025 RepID=UPI0009B86CA3|nr:MULTISPECIES: FAD-dependent oxidoreductase [Rhodococcus]OZD86174.1 amine oxidase [Rhodococcus sp. 05-2256-B4]OZD96286.1 amine oxidase [Rhodococcus sp. 05-2256-B2]OZD96709.1 amine oxidase [Rhodococcus sp. 05-2256-B3]OZD99685.1 amine oxidase [Rhodococcus sp. 05-2256-B1]
MQGRIVVTRRVAVVGSGVAGLTAAYALSKNSSVTLYEADSRLGGHADTHFVDGPGGPVGVDTGFIVHNDRTYPTLLRLFDELDVPTQDSDMSMSVRCDGCGLEYSGGQGMRGILAQRTAVLRPRFVSMLLDVKRFHRLATELLEREDAADTETTLAQFLEQHSFSAYFESHFMTPLVSAVWSCDPDTALAYPARYLFTFLRHHGMLTVTGSPTWRTVTGGSIEYVRRVAEHIDEVLLGNPVHAVYRSVDSVQIRDGHDDLRTFDAAVIAVHPGAALKMLAEPTALEHSVLGAMPYSVNHTALHTDSSVLPRNIRARASWNYHLPSCSAKPDRVLVSYDLTRLQRLGDSDRRMLVTLGGADRIDPNTVLDEMTYEHPQYTPESVAAQRRLPELDTDTVSFAGAYHGWGFHEDGALSGARAAQRVGASWL